MRVALIGNQNSGKTTLFNSLTGTNQKVGNWAGVTIEKKVGTIRKTDISVVDLPGIYSLSPYTSEEKVSMEYLLSKEPDIIVNIVDASVLERGLYLTTQLLELDIPCIICLNMCDTLEKKGISIDVEALEKQLKTKVIKISALKKQGIAELISELQKPNRKQHIKVYDNDILFALDAIESRLKCNNRKFIATKILEGDKRFQLDIDIATLVSNLETKYKMDIEEIIATYRYDYLDILVSKVLKKIPVKAPITDKIDKVLLNKYIGIPIFLVIMTGIYFLSVGIVGTLTIDWISGAIDNLSQSLESWLISVGASHILISLIVYGIMGGVGAVLAFVPQLIILFLLIGILETTGYMARVALLLDKVFIKLGLSGKSLIPFILGSGCSVPAIMSARTVESKDEHTMTVMLTPFIPCNAKLPIITLFSSFFFKDYAFLISVSLYFFAIVIIVMSALVLKKLFYKNSSSTFITELPEYKMPSPSYIFRDVSEKVIAFIKRAGTVIFLASIIVWTLSSFTYKFQFADNISQSLLAGLGRIISPLFYPMLGVNSWGAAVSAIQGLVAKEQVISSLNIIAGLSDGAEYGIFESSIFNFFTPASAYAFMVFNLFSAPCLGAIGAMKKELNSGKMTTYAIVFQTILAFLVSYIVYFLGTYVFVKGDIDAIIILALLVIIIAVIVFIVKKRKKFGKCSSCPYCGKCISSCDKKEDKS